MKVGVSTNSAEGKGGMRDVRKNICESKSTYVRRGREYEIHKTRRHPATERNDMRIDKSKTTGERRAEYGALRKTARHNEKMEKITDSMYSRGRQRRPA